jgi:uncharacterized OB-fold protein
MTNTAIHPGLYDPYNPTPALNGTRCEKCKVNYFPPLGMGCERCGNPDLRSVTLSTNGTVHSAAMVHLHGGKDIDAPFVVVEIALDDGPLIRGLLANNTNDDVIGARVSGQWMKRVDDDGNVSVEPRFITDAESGESL